VVLACLAGLAWAQDSEIESSFKKLDAAEEQRLRAVLEAPVPVGSPQSVLHNHFQEKEVAARLLGSGPRLEVVVREAMRYLPSAHLREKLGAIQIFKGELEEGNALKQAAIATGGPFLGAVVSAAVICDLVVQNQIEGARLALAEAEKRIKLATSIAKTNSDKNFLSRAAAGSFACLSWLEQGLGHYSEGVVAAEKAVASGRVSLTQMEGLGLTQSINTQRQMLDFIRVKHRAYIAAGQLHNAELALAEAMRFSSEVNLPANYFGGILFEAGKLRFAQREFRQSESLMRKADAAWEGLGWPATNSSRVSTVWNTAQALIGQKKWSQALQEIQKLDVTTEGGQLRKDDPFQSYDRAVVYLGNGRYREAIPLFETAASLSRQNFGESHFYTAQTTGLQGVALWRSGTAENKARALPLLKAAVRSYMSAANADYLENIGIRKELREITFAAYLEAISSTAGEDATEALGAADWVRGGTVQEALNDAAVRAAASTPALSDVVRRDQDARNEIKGLRSFLSGDAGSAKTPLPQIATQMRERITVLENQRVQLQAEIKAKFPDYERLVRPTSPSVQQVAKQLSPDQALLMLLPTTDAVYVWAVTAERPPAFARAPLSEARVDQLIGRLRRQLDFAAGGGSQFDSAAAFELYDKLLAPLAPTLQGKTQLIVAAGGNLSQIPFGILHTRANGGTGSQAPWLIKEASIAQVPSLSAWLAIKSLAKSKPASQSFAGWGDPAFNASAAAANASLAQANGPLSRSVVLSRAATLTQLDAAELSAPVTSALKYADIPPLPDTRDELLAIATTLHADAGSDLHLGPQATRDSVLQANKSGQLGNKRVIAFATHGLMAGDLPNLTQPALALAATGQEQTNPLAPLLTLEDVLTLKLNADWVVLSACNTAAADGKAEEALSGLARGFFYAGSRSLLVTHWAVESESAKELTTSTFAHYAANPNAPKAESLRQAMLQVMANPKYAHPAYWAPYALVGDGGGSAVCNKWLC